MDSLKTGTYYWFRQVYEKHWRIGYVGEDGSGNQWLHITGVAEPWVVSNMMLTMFDWIEIQKPG